MAGRRVEFDNQLALFRFSQMFTPILAGAAGPFPRGISDQSFVDESDVKVSGTWRYAYRAVDEKGQFIDLLVRKKRQDRSSHMVLR